MSTPNRNHIFRFLIDSALISCSIVAILAITALRIYYGNSSEFGFPIQDLAFIFTYAFGLTLLLICTILLISYFSSCYQKVASLFSVLILLLWLQSNFFVWDYGRLNSNHINWANFSYVRNLEIAIFVLAFFIWIRYRNEIYKLSVYFLGFLLVFQFLDGIGQIKKAPPISIDKHYVMDQKNEFLFSSKDNVILIVLDAFQGSIFNQIIIEDPSYKKFFTGFTFFKNAQSSFFSTRLSLTNILTGTAYDNSMPVRQYQWQNLSENSLPLSLQSYGYQTEYYDVFGYGVLPLTFKIWSNARRSTSFYEFIPQYTKLIQSVIFRLSPQFFKEYFYFQGIWRWKLQINTAVKILFYFKETTFKELKKKDVSQNINTNSSPRFISFPLNYHPDIEFINRFMNQHKIGDTHKMFKLFHLMGIHPPRNFDENFNFDPALNGNMNQIATSARGTLKLMNIFLSQLKELKIYDSATILIMGDHGIGLPINSSQDAHNKALSAQSLRLNFDTLKGGAMPLVLIKLPYSNEPLKISENPVALSDIPNTVLEIIGKKSIFSGKSMFQQSEINRDRYVRIHAYHEDKFDYFGDLQELVIKGDVYDDHSWNFTGRILKPRETNIERVKAERSEYLKTMIPLYPIHGGEAFAIPPYAELNNTMSANRAFDKIWRETGWVPVDSPNGQNSNKAILGTQLSTPEIVKAYSIKTRFDVEYFAPKSWLFQGSNDGKEWITLDTQKNISDWVNGGKVKIFKFTNSKAFNTYRLKITESQDGRGIHIDEFELFKEEINR